LASYLSDPSGSPTCPDFGRSLARGNLPTLSATDQKIGTRTATRPGRPVPRGADHWSRAEASHGNHWHGRASDARMLWGPAPLGCLARVVTASVSVAPTLGYSTRRGHCDGSRISRGSIGLPPARPRDDPLRMAAVLYLPAVFLVLTLLTSWLGREASGSYTGDVLLASFVGLALSWLYGVSHLISYRCPRCGRRLSRAIPQGQPEPSVYYLCTECRIVWNLGWSLGEKG